MNYMIGGIKTQREKRRVGRRDAGGAMLTSGDDDAGTGNCRRMFSNQVAKSSGKTAGASVKPAAGNLDSMVC